MVPLKPVESTAESRKCSRSTPETKKRSASDRALDWGRGHVVLVRRGVGGQQAGELEVGRGLGGIGTEMLGLTVRTGALEGEVAGGVSLSIASGELGDVVADLGGGGDRLDRSRGVGGGRAVTTGCQGGSGQGEAGERRDAAATRTGDGSHSIEYSFGEPKLRKLRRSFDRSRRQVARWAHSGTGRTIVAASARTPRPLAVNEGHMGALHDRRKYVQCSQPPASRPQGSCSAHPTSTD